MYCLYYWSVFTGALTLSLQVAAFGPTEVILSFYGMILVLLNKVVFCFKGAVPPLTNSYVLLLFFLLISFGYRIT